MPRTLIAVSCLIAGLVAALPGLNSPAQATALKLKIINKSTVALNSFTVTLRGASAATSPNRLPSPLAPGATTTPPLAFDPGGTACVFDLTFTSASGKVTNQPDTDLCQTDGIVFQ
jgi:hypothetical protein